MKRFFAFITVLCLTVALFPWTSRAAGEIEIFTPEQLQKIGVDPAYPLDGDYVLTADIDLSGRTWYPIGNPTGDKTSGFSGTFDGQGHVIRNMTSGTEKKALAHADDGWGFFAYLDGAEVRNLVLDGVQFNVYAEYDLSDGDPAGYNGVGAVAGYIAGGASVEQVSVINSTLQDLGSRQTRVGGIIGSVTGTGGTVRNCLFEGTVIGAFQYFDSLDYFNNQCAVAGIVGSASGKCTVENCLAVGAAVLPGYGYAHPIAANYTAPATGAVLKNCYYSFTLTLGQYGVAGTDKGGVSELLDSELYGGGFSRLGDVWTVAAGQIPCPSGAFVVRKSLSLQEAEKALSDALSGYVATNYTTAEDLLSFADFVLAGDFEYSWSEPFALTPATDQAGAVSGVISVSSAGNSRSVPVRLTVPPLPETTYEFSTQTKGSAQGTVTVKFTEKTRRTHTLRWGTAEGPSLEYSPLDTFNDAGKTVRIALRRNTLIPIGMTHLWLCDGTAPVLALPLPASRLLPAREPSYVFGVMSDLHLDNDVDTLAVDAVMAGYEASGVDFVVSLGDNTSNNRVDQLANWKSLKLKYPSVTVYSTLGNHDVLPRHTEGGIQDFDEDKYRDLVKDSLERFQKYFENTEDIDFTVEQGDDLLIFLGLGDADEVSESATKGGQALGKAQLEWLDETLDQYYNEDEKTGNVFLMFHFYARDTIDTVTTASALHVGSSKEMEKILNKYPGVIYFSGHNHYAFDVGMNIYDRAEYTMLHCPSASRSTILKDKGHNMGREGYYVEVYGDCVVVKGYSFLRGEWQTSAMFLLSAGDSLTVSGDESVTVGGAHGDPGTAPAGTDSSGASSAGSDGVEEESSALLWVVLAAAGGVALAAGVLILVMKRK